jgi:hypothetical protein
LYLRFRGKNKEAIDATHFFLGAAFLAGAAEAAGAEAPGLFCLGIGILFPSLVNL